ncbi:MAG: glutaredoxin family protein [Vitreoscilla sp.]|nr:glutaredoxin family protein [Vitreoscilla sp.]
MDIALLNALRSIARPTLVLGGLLTLACLPAQAVYKVVGPDGKVTYTDTPPQTGNAQVKPMATGSGGGGGLDLANLPFEVRQAATRYPVTLYANANCQPCDAGRQLLQQRGVPFAEKRVNDTGTDIAALQRLAGTNRLPVLTIGQQQVKGLVPADWNSFLDAAGYPREAKLPASYRAPAPTAFVAPAEPAPAAAVEAPAATTAEPPARAGSGPNIRF